MNALERKQELLDAVKKSDLPRLKTLLQEGGDVNAIYPNGMDGLNIDAAMDADAGDGGFAADAVDAGFGADGGGGY